MPREQRTAGLRITRCASGAASGARTERVTLKALEQARADLGAQKIALGLVFADPKHPLEKVLQALRKADNEISWLGCSSAGGLTERGVNTSGVVLLLCSWGDAMHREAGPSPLQDDPTASAGSLIAPLRDLALEGERRAYNGRATLLLGDGSTPLVEPLVQEMRRRIGLEHTIVGASASPVPPDGRSAVTAGGAVMRSASVAAHVISKRAWGVGIGQGAVPCGPRMTITRSTGSVVHELDGRPAAEVYREFARGRGVELKTEEDLADFLIRHELGLYLFDEIVRIRLGLGEDEDGSLRFAGEVPEGMSAAIVAGSPDGMIEAAREAAQQAKDALGDAKPAGLLLFSCITRSIVLGERYSEELDAINSVFGAALPKVGLVCHGEIARVPHKLDGFHNHTLVIVAIPQ